MDFDVVLQWAKAEVLVNTGSIVESVRVLYRTLDLLRDRSLGPETTHLVHPLFTPRSERERAKAYEAHTRLRLATLLLNYTIHYEDARLVLEPSYALLEDESDLLEKLRYYRTMALIFIRKGLKHRAIEFYRTALHACSTPPSSCSLTLEGEKKEIPGWIRTAYDILLLEVQTHAWVHPELSFREKDHPLFPQLREGGWPELSGYVLHVLEALRNHDPATAKALLFPTSESRSEENSEQKFFLPENFETKRSASWFTLLHLLFLHVSGQDPTPRLDSALQAEDETGWFPDFFLESLPEENAPERAHVKRRAWGSRSYRVVLLCLEVWSRVTFGSETLDSWPTFSPSSTPALEKEELSRETEQQRSEKDHILSQKVEQEVRWLEDEVHYLASLRRAPRRHLSPLHLDYLSFLLGCKFVLWGYLAFHAILTLDLSTAVSRLYELYTLLRAYPVGLLRGDSIHRQNLHWLLFLLARICQDESSAQHHITQFCAWRSPSRYLDQVFLHALRRNSEFEQVEFNTRERFVAWKKWIQITSLISPPNRVKDATEGFLPLAWRVFQLVKGRQKLPPIPEETAPPSEEISAADEKGILQVLDFRTVERLGTSLRAMCLRYMSRWAFPHDPEAVLYWGRRALAMAQRRGDALEELQSLSWLLVHGKVRIPREARQRRVWCEAYHTLLERYNREVRHVTGVNLRRDVLAVTFSFPPRSVSTLGGLTLSSPWGMVKPAEEDGVGSSSKLPATQWREIAYYTSWGAKKESTSSVLESRSPLVYHFP